MPGQAHCGRTESMLPKGRGQGCACDNGLCSRQALIATCRDWVAIFTCEVDIINFITWHESDLSYFIHDVHHLHFCYPTRSLHSFQASARTRRPAFLHQMKYSPSLFSAVLRLVAGVSCIPVWRSVDQGFTVGKKPMGTGDCEVHSCGDNTDVFAGTVDSDDGMKDMPWCTLQAFLPCSTNDNVYRETAYRLHCTSTTASP